MIYPIGQNVHRGYVWGITLIILYQRHQYDKMIGVNFIKNSKRPNFDAFTIFQ